MKHLLACITVCIATGSVLGMAGQADMEEAAASQSRYCKAVAQWQDGAERGVSEADMYNDGQKYGHPDYNDNADEVCHEQ